MGGDGVGILSVRRMLHGGEILHIQIVRHHHQTAGVLTGGAAHAHAALRQAVDLGVAGAGEAPLIQILAHEAEGSLLRQRTDGTGAEHLRLSEHLDGVAMGAGLIFAGEVQVDIGHLTAAVAEEGLEGDVKAVFDILGAALGAHLIGHIGAAAVAAVGDELVMQALRIGAAVMGRQGVDLRDAGHVGHEGRAHGASRAHQIAVLQAALHQLLGRHVDHIVLAQNAAQLHVQAVHDELGGIFAVEGVALGPNLVVKFLSGVSKAGREQLTRGQQLDLLAHIGDEAGIIDDHFLRLFRAEVGKLLQHLIGGLEVDGQGFIGIGELLAGQQHMAVDLVLRLLKMDVAGGADRLAQLLAQTDDGAVELPQVLLRLDIAVADHELVVAQGLDLQIVVERGDAAQLRPVLMVGHRLEKLARLAGRTDDEALAVGHQLRLGDDRHALEVLQVGGGDQLVEVFQTQLILGENDDMLRETAGFAALRAQFQHFFVDLLQTGKAVLLPHLLKEGDEHVGHHGSVIAGAVVVEGGQVQMLCHDVQLVLVQLRQQVLGEDQRVHIGGVEGQAHLAAALADETDIELGVVGRQRAVTHEGEEIPQRFLQLGGIRQHGIGDAGEADDLGGQAAIGVDEGLETLGDFTVFQHHGADLGDGLPIHLQAGGLDIEADDLIGKILILPAMDHDAVVHIVDEVALHAVEDLNSLVVVPRIGEGLRHAVVGDGDGGVAPALGEIDDALGIGEGVHVGHAGVEMELHALAGCGVLAALVTDLDNVLGIELDVLAVAGQLDEALHPQPHTRLDGIADLLRLLALQVLADGDRVFIVRHVEGQAPHAGAAGLVALGGKDLTLHHHAAHLGVEPLHADDFAFDLLAHEDVAAALVVLAGGAADAQGQPAQVVLLLQQLLQRAAGGVGELLPRLQLQLHAAVLTIQQAAGDAGVMQQQPQLAGWHKAFKKIKKRYLFGHRDDHSFRNQCQFAARRRRINRL